MEIILSLKTKQTAFCFQICWTITNWIIQYLNREFSIFEQSKFFWKNYVLYLLFKFVERQNRVTDDGKQFGNIWQHRELAHNECPIWTSTKKKTNINLIMNCFPGGKYSLYFKVDWWRSERAAAHGLICSESNKMSKHCQPVTISNFIVPTHSASCQVPVMRPTAANTCLYISSK